MSTEVNPFCFAVAKCEDCKDQFCVVVLEKGNPRPAELKDSKHGEFEPIMEKAREYNEWLSLDQKQVKNIVHSVSSLNREVKIFLQDDQAKKRHLHQFRM